MTTAKLDQTCMVLCTIGMCIPGPEYQANSLGLWVLEFRSYYYTHLQQKYTTVLRHFQTKGNSTISEEGVLAGLYLTGGQVLRAVNWWSSRTRALLNCTPYYSGLEINDLFVCV